MESRAFTIFHPVKKFYFTESNILIIIVCVLGVLAVVTHFCKIELPQPVAEIVMYVMLGVLFAAPILNVTSGYRYQPLPGRLHGTITFTPVAITINEAILPIETIASLEFVFNDYKDDISEYSRYSYNGRKIMV